MQHSHQTVTDSSLQQVLNQVQLNNLLALAPPGSAAAFELCREIAAPSGAAATTGMGTPLTEHHQVSCGLDNHSAPVLVSVYGV